MLLHYVPNEPVYFLFAFFWFGAVPWHFLKVKCVYSQRRLRKAINSNLVLFYKYCTWKILTGSVWARTSWPILKPHKQELCSDMPIVASSFNIENSFQNQSGPTRLSVNASLQILNYTGQHRVENTVQLTWSDRSTRSDRGWFKLACWLARHCHNIAAAQKAHCSFFPRLATYLPISGLFSAYRRWTDVTVSRGKKTTTN